MTELLFNVAELPRAQIPLGIRAENDVTQVTLDFAAWAEEYGAGVVQLLVLRSGDTAPYPVLLAQSGTEATWTVSSTDLAFPGELRAEYVYTVGTAIKKSAVIRFSIARDIGTPGEAPHPYEDWLEQLTALAAQTQQAALDVQAAQDVLQAAGLPTGSGGSAGTRDYDALSNRPQINGVTLSGNQSGAALGLDSVCVVTRSTPLADILAAAQNNKIVLLSEGVGAMRPYNVMLLSKIIPINRMLETHVEGETYVDPVSGVPMFAPSHTEYTSQDGLLAYFVNVSSIDGVAIFNFDDTGNYNDKICVDIKTCFAWYEDGVLGETSWSATGLNRAAPLSSPDFTGAPTAPTPTAGDSSTKIATTRFVKDAIDAAITALREELENVVEPAALSDTLDSGLLDSMILA